MSKVIASFLTRFGQKNQIANWGDQSKPDKYVSAAAGWDIVPLRVRSQSVKMPFRHYLFALFGQSLELDPK